MKKNLLIIALSITAYCKAQTNFCGTDTFREAQLKTDPSYKQQEDKQNQLIYNYIISHGTPTTENRLLVYTIPIVFHIIHQGGPENIADTTIINAINQLNLRFQDVAPYNDATGHPVNIQFCLASIDPWGNPTTGITRDTSFHTNLSNYGNIAEDIALKNVNRWCPATYLNIWTIKTVCCGIGAFSAFPSTSIGNDGIVIKYNGLSGYGLSHEVGHYFDLYHTFQGGCNNFNCLIDGDGVCDTPPDATNNYTVCGGNSCSTEMNDTSGVNPFTTDQNDLPNYMDYTLCPLSFTLGQSNRMYFSLINLRPTLLQSFGCGNNFGAAMPVASFTIDSSFSLCTGTIGFHSTSTNSLYAAWDFNNDGRIDDVGDSIIHTFTTSGFYNVKLIVSGYGGSDSVVHTFHIYVNPYPTYPISPFYSGLTIDPVSHLPTACIGTSVTLYAVSGFTSYLWSTGDTTQYITLTVDSTTHISLTVIDNSGRTINSCTPFTAYVNPRLHPTIIVGADTTNCGQLMTIRLLPNPYWFPATNTWYDNGVWSSANQFVLANYWSPGINNLWIANNIDPIGCSTNSDTLTFFVNQPPPLTISQQGNILTLPYHCAFTQWYNGAVPISVNDSLLTVTGNGCYWAICASCGYYNSDTICFTNVGIQENNFDNGITISPNPFTSTTTITFNEEQKHTTISVTDVLGNSILQSTINGKQYTIEKGEMKAGIYFVQITDEKKNIVNRKIVVQ